MKKISKYFVIILIFISLIVSICFIPFKATNFIPIIEEQVEKDLGVKVNIESLIFQFGPLLKLKTPIIHLMYNDGKKFAQLNNVKIFIDWVSLIKQSPRVDTLKAKNLIIQVTSQDEDLINLLNSIERLNKNRATNLKIKDYKFVYKNYNNNENYILQGPELDLKRHKNSKNPKIITKGEFKINSQTYITYDFSLLPNIDLTNNCKEIKILPFLEQVRDLDFHSDVIADIKLYKDNNDLIQTSGFLNIDNISVLDRAQKDPKSFLYLTLWGNKASLLSNIYVSQNKKIYIEGMINNSKKRILDIKVKTDDIELKDLYNKLKIAINFAPFKNITTLNGYLNADFSVKGDIEKIKSTGFIKIKNAEVLADGLEIKNINSDIDLSNNVITINNAIGYVNDAPLILKGKFDNEMNLELLMNKVDLKYLLPSSYGVKDGIISLILNISGPIDKITHKENITIDNLKISNDAYNISLDNFKYDTNKNNIASLKNIIFKTNITEEIKIPHANLTIDQDSIFIPDTDIYMPNSKLVLKGVINNYKTYNYDFVYDFKGYINSKDILQFKNYSNRYPLKLNISGNKASQNINSQVLLEKTDVFDESLLLNFNAKLAKNILKIDDLSLNTFAGDFLNDVKFNVKSSKKLLINGTLENLADPCFKNVRIFIPQLFNFKFKDTMAQIKGDIFLNGKPEILDIVGQISLANLYNQTLQLSVNNCNLDFNKNNLIINAPLVKISDSAMGLNALVSTNLTNEILIKYLNIKSKFFNTDTFLMYKDLPNFDKKPIIIQDGKFYSEKVLTNLYQEHLYFDAFNSDFSLNGTNLLIKNISSELFNGKISGELNFDLKNEKFDMKLMTRGISAEPIFNIISIKKDSISGTMDLDSKIKGSLTSKSSLEGNIKFIVRNGRMGTLGKLEHLLYAQNVIADNMLRTTLSVVTKAITLKDTGLFKYLQGDIDINEGIATIKLLQSQGPLMSLYIKGQYDLLSNYARLVVLGRLGNEIITGLGAFGDFSFNKLLIMLTGEDEKQTVLIEDYEKIPQLYVKNTKEFRSIIDGIIDKSSSVKSFNWVSYSEKSLRQKEVPLSETKIPDFVEALPY